MFELWQSISGLSLIFCVYYRLLSNCIDCTANHTLYIIPQPPMSLVYPFIINHSQARCWVDELIHCLTFFLNRSLYSSCVCIIYPSLICQSKFGNFFFIYYYFLWHFLIYWNLFLWFYIFFRVHYRVLSILILIRFDSLDHLTYWPIPSYLILFLLCII